MLNTVQMNGNNSVDYIDKNDGETHFERIGDEEFN